MRVSMKALTYFLVAAEHESIARAAEAQNVVPSAISSAIDQVEQAFDMTLVQRFPAKGIVPNAAGRALIRRIRNAVDEYESLFTEGAALRGGLSGMLTVGYYAPVAPAFMPAIVRPLVEANPDLRLSFVACDNERAQEGLLGGAFDAIVFVADEVRTGIVYETLIDAPPYLLAPADHPLARQAAVSLDVLADTPLVLLDLPFTSAYYRGLLDRAGIEATFIATASTTEMVRSLVGAGLGCALLNMRPSTGTTYAGDRVAAIPIDPAPAPLRLVVGRVDGKPRRLVETFMRACRDHFSSRAGADTIVLAE